MYQLNPHTALEVIPAVPPAPKFQFFQAIAVKNSDRQGTIVGMEYISPIIALVEDISSGWRYTIRPEAGIGKQAEDVLDADFEPFTIREQRLED